MELNVFMRELESALVQRGIPNETALRHVSNLKRTFTEDDLSEIEAMRSNEQIDALADSLAVILNRKRSQQPPVPAEPQPEPDFSVQSGFDPGPVPEQSGQDSPFLIDPGEIPQQTAPPDTIQTAQPRPGQNRPAAGGRQNGKADDYPTAAYPLSRDADPYDNEEDEPSVSRKPRKKPAQAPAGRRKEQQKSVDDYFEYAPDAAPSTKGMIIFWLLFFVTLPLTIVLAAALFGIFAGLFVAMAVLIVASIAVVIALVAGGSVASLVAVVFGITQLLHIGGGTLIAGLYEIGLGVMVAGIVLFFAVLLYNFAIRFLPWVMGKLGTFLGFLCGKVKDLFLYLRRECYQL